MFAPGWGSVQTGHTGRRMSALAETVKAIDDMIQSLDNAARERKRGMGLGLSVCDGIVSAHRGHIDVASDLRLPA